MSQQSTSTAVLLGPGSPTDSKQSPKSPNKLFTKLFGDVSEHIFIEDIADDADDLLDDDYFCLSFDEVDDRISEFQEDELVREAIAKGMDLREYAHNIEAELNVIEREHEYDLIGQTRNFVELHNQIQSCDQILATMENMLSVFQTDLGNISSEIQSLQEKSASMNVKLDNRTLVAKQLDAVLDGTVIPPSMISKIAESDVDEVWLSYLTELNKKMSYVKSHQGRNVKALKDVGPELEKLRLKATEKIRDFLLAKIKSLRIPNTNVQILQQTVLLKYKALHAFVMERHSEVAHEIRQTYINTMRWYFSNHFERYNRGLQKLQSTVADKNDLIGYDESVRKGGLFGSSRIALTDKANIYALGERINTLRNQDAGVILVHVAEGSGQKYPYEALFRSFNLTFIDNASSEYLFLVEFFSKSDRPATDAAREVFIEIFEPTICMGLNATKQYVDTTYDAVGVLLCVRLNTQFALELQRRRVPALESYTNQTNMLLWPRFQAIMDLHIDSVLKVGSKIAARDVHPHYVTRRYAEFAASILTLNEEYNDPILTNSLGRLRTEIELLLNKMSTEFVDDKNRYIFLINNYDLVMTILNEGYSKGVEAEVNHFKQLLDAKVAAFVEEELEPYFSDLISLVKQAEQMGGDAIDFSRYEHVAANFAQIWRQHITSINASVIQHFSNFRNGTAILHMTLGQLLLYYIRFHSLLEERIREGGLRLKQQPVGVETVKVEIKKYRSNF